MKTISPLSFLIITLTAFSTITYAQEASTELVKVNSEISDTNRANLDEFINHIESSLENTPVTEPNNLAIENQNTATTQNIATTANKTVAIISNTTTLANNSVPSDAVKATTEPTTTTTSNKATNNSDNSQKNKISIVEILQLGASLASLLLSAYL